MIKLIKAVAVVGIVVAGIALARKPKKKETTIEELRRYSDLPPREFHKWAE